MRALLSCAVLSGLAGCGQKGPLFLPDKGGAVVTKPAGAATETPTENTPQPAQEPASTDKRTER
jgi:predicted small lipoprotein YifL